jgi:hypothetical protein
MALDCVNFYRWLLVLRVVLLQQVLDSVPGLVRQ